MQSTLVKSMSAGLMLMISIGVSADYPVAGTNPSMRPVEAPVIHQVHRDSAWYQQALHGIEEPYPTSFRFLEDQGDWHTPFNQPGLTGPYDIRRWHR